MTSGASSVGSHSSPHTSPLSPPSSNGTQDTALATVKMKEVISTPPALPSKPLTLRKYSYQHFNSSIEGQDQLEKHYEILCKRQKKVNLGRCWMQCIAIVAAIAFFCLIAFFWYAALPCILLSIGMGVGTGILGHKAHKLAEEKASLRKQIDAIQTPYPQLNDKANKKSSKCLTKPIPDFRSPSLLTTSSHLNLYGLDPHVNSISQARFSKKGRLFLGWDHRPAPLNDLQGGRRELAISDQQLVEKLETSYEILGVEGNNLYFTFAWLIDEPLAKQAAQNLPSAELLDGRSEWVNQWTQWTQQQATDPANPEPLQQKKKLLSALLFLPTDSCYSRLTSQLAETLTIDQFSSYVESLPPNEGLNQIRDRLNNWDSQNPENKIRLLTYIAHYANLPQIALLPKENLQNLPLETKKYLGEVCKEMILMHRMQAEPNLAMLYATARRDEYLSTYTAARKINDGVPELISLCRVFNKRLILFGSEWMHTGKVKTDQEGNILPFINIGPTDDPNPLQLFCTQKRSKYYLLKEKNSQT